MLQSLYQNKPEVWNAQKCERMAKRVARDGLGTKYPWPGYIGSNFGPVRYNGGCIREGEHYAGEEFPLPVVADGFEVIHVRTWGYRIRRIGEK